MDKFKVISGFNIDIIDDSIVMKEGRYFDIDNSLYKNHPKAKFIKNTGIFYFYISENYSIYMTKNPYKNDTLIRELNIDSIGLKITIGEVPPSSRISEDAINDIVDTKLSELNIESDDTIMENRLESITITDGYITVSSHIGSLTEIYVEDMGEIDVKTITGISLNNIILGTNELNGKQAKVIYDTIISL